MRLTGCRLDSGPHRDRVKVLTNPLASYTMFNQVKERLFGDKKGPSIDFRTVLATIELRLQTAINDAKPIDKSWSTNLIPPIWIEMENENLIEEGK